jgi:hypothetical protein
MADSPKRIGPIALGNVAATIYTTPSGTDFTVRNVHVANESAVDARFTMSIGVDGAGNRIYRNVEVIGNGGAFDWSGYMPLAAGEIIEVLADLPSTLTITISGVETT